MNHPDVTSGDAARPTAHSPSFRIAVILIAIVGLVAAASLPYVFGYGWFGHRLVLYGQGELYVLNLTDSARQISVDEQTPTLVSGDDAAILPLVGGPTTVTMLDKAGTAIEQWELEPHRSDALLNLADDTCLVVAEVSHLFDDAPLEVEITKTIEAGIGVYVLGSHNVIWPRAYPGIADADSTQQILSVEVTDCQLLDDKPFLSEYLQSRLQQRM